MNKDCEEHLTELIEFYSETDIDDLEYLKKLFIRNLKDVRNRYVKYDKSRKQIIDELEKFMKDLICSEYAQKIDTYKDGIEDCINELKRLKESGKDE